MFSNIGFWHWQCILHCLIKKELRRIVNQRKDKQKMCNKNAQLLGRNILIYFKEEKFCEIVFNLAHNKLNLPSSLFTKDRLFLCLPHPAWWNGHVKTDILKMQRMIVELVKRRICAHICIP